MRISQEEIQDLMIQNDVVNLFSWSKYNTYLNDPYSYLLRYILKIPEDKVSNAYSFLGSVTHNLLERFYDDSLTNKEMVKEFEDKIFEQKLMDIRFMSDDEKNNTIGDRDVENVKHFLYNYKKDENAHLEKLMYIKIGEHLFYGYIDKMHTKDNILYIDDFKTSAIYKNDKIDKEKGQLLLYSMAINKMSQIPFDKMKARWNFCKYVNVDCEQVNGKIVRTTSERNIILNTLKAKLKTWCSKFGYSIDDFEKWFEMADKLNREKFLDIDCLSPFPSDIKNKFKIKDCLVQIEINIEEVEKFLLQIKENCDIIIDKEKEYSILRDNNLFWIDIDNKNSFFFTNLCGYSAKHHAPLKKYLDSLTFMSNESSSFDKKSKEDNEFLKALLGD